MSDYCKCCSSNIAWIEVHHSICFEVIMDSDPKEIAYEICENSKIELGENAPNLNELIVLIEDIQYAYQPSTIKRVSIHEAGHPVVAYHYGNKFEFIQVGGEIDSVGVVKTTKKSDSEKKLEETDPAKLTDLFWAEIDEKCYILLGGVAALHIYGGKRRVYPILGARVDIDNCKNLLKIVPKYSSTVEVIYSQFFNEVVKILEEKWKAVEALAQVLEDKWLDDCAFIEGKEVERIIEKSLT